MSLPSAWVIAGVQLSFALSWTVYVIYFPQLAKAAGLAPVIVPWLLALDQTIFALSDWMSGAYADRVLAKFRQLAPWLILATLVSVAAFVCLPWVAPRVGKAGLLALAVIWVVSSAALRAPPLALLGRYTAPLRRPRLATIVLLGMGVAGAAAPFAGVALANVDPRIPFVAAGSAVMLMASLLYFVERTLSAQAANITTVGANPNPGARIPIGVGMIAVITFFLALGFQAEMLTFPRQIAQLALPHQQPWLQPLFWVGFTLAMLPASLLIDRLGVSRTLLAMSVLGAAAAANCAMSRDLASTLVGQVLAGAAWAGILASLLSLALREGARAGRVAGVVFGMLALLAAVRIASAQLGVPQMPALARLLAWAPVGAWIVAAILILSDAAARYQRKPTITGR